MKTSNSFRCLILQELLNALIALLLTIMNLLEKHNIRTIRNVMTIMFISVMVLSTFLYAHNRTHRMTNNYDDRILDSMENTGLAKVVNLSKDTIDIANSYSGKSMLIAVGLLSCNDCLEHLSSELSRELAEHSVQCIAISQSEATSSSRRQHQKRIRTLMPCVSSVYFFTQDSVIIQGKAHNIDVEPTPMLILRNGRREMYMEYQEIFNSSGQITQSAIQTIAQFYSQQIN